MPAYLESRVDEFIGTPDGIILGRLASAYTEDGFVSQYTAQTRAWEDAVPLLKQAFSLVMRDHQAAGSWTLLLELPLYRLRRRLDALILTPSLIVVLELKVGESVFLSPDRRQVEEYALDLRDFHEHSSRAPILPVLWCTEAPSNFQYVPSLVGGTVAPVVQIGQGDMGDLLLRLSAQAAHLPSVVREDWSEGAYKPVPSIVDAATTLFSEHGVSEIAQADASNLLEAAETVVQLITDAERFGRRIVVFLTGVPGSGKTLAGLQIVHRSTESSNRESGDIVYLSGNTPLVTVLREALTEDKHSRERAGDRRRNKAEIRREVRTRIQHIMDFLKEYLSGDADSPPHERAIVFDEAQRAWDESYGKQKFGRSASEPRLLLDIMSRRSDWCAIIGLIGGGQEINSGENGIAEWGDALRSLSKTELASWTVFGPTGIVEGDDATANLRIGSLPGVEVQVLDDLALKVPLRTYRSPLITDWVSAVLEAREEDARTIAGRIERFPIMLTRDDALAKKWLVEQSRGERRFGLVASSSASRLRADGYGVTLNATEGQNIAYWYLKPRGDVRSSYSLEITANEYTTQGLELDFVGLCWGGDMRIDSGKWTTRQFRGNRWVSATGDRRRYVLNSYRVLMTRAREGLVMWVPRGDSSDPTRPPMDYDRTAEFLVQCGANRLSCP